MRACAANGEVKAEFLQSGSGGAVRLALKTGTSLPDVMRSRPEGHPAPRKFSRQSQPVGQAILYRAAQNAVPHRESYCRNVQHMAQ
jgi:hypothetical protein